MSGGKLFVVPTPIGNLGDMTPRALDVLRSVQFVLAEDTRTTGKLLRHFGIDRPLKSFHQHNEHRSVEGWVEAMMAGAQLALCSDAGTPGISDPGYLLVRACVASNIAVECLPGATAFVPALVTSGLPCDRFYFEGFLPHKKGRQKEVGRPARDALHRGALRKPTSGREIAYPTCRTRCRKATHRGEPRNFKTSRRNPSWHNFRCSRCPLTT